MTKFLWGGAALAALVAIAPASAQPVQSPMVPRAPMAQVQTRAQIGTQVATMFQRLDANRDGFVTRAESQANAGVRGNRQGRMMQRRANVTPQQRAARQAARFDRIDLNRDGAVTRDEFTRATAMRQQRVGAAGQRMRQPRAAMRGMGGRGMGGGGMGALRGRMFEMADVNRDSRISLQEATAAAYRRFDMADANRDGQLTRDEHVQARQQMRTQRQPR